MNYNMNEKGNENEKRRIRYFAFGIAPLRLSNVFVLGALLETTKYCRISVARALDEARATEQTESQMEIHPKLRPS